MKSILISINPKWCEKIASSQKTIEVRKTRPKIEPPFKCYIYCTACRDFYRIGCLRYGCDELYKTPDGDVKYGTSVELMAFDDNDYGPENFLNRKVIGEFVCDEIFDWHCGYDSRYDTNCLIAMTCLDAGELYAYGQGKPLYGWHISDLKIYDTPKALESFLVEANQTYDCPILTPLKRAPQSWSYVEEKRK